MKSTIQIASVILGAWTAVAIAGETCVNLPARTGVGRDEGSYDDKSSWCPSQIEQCGYICGGNAQTNICDYGSPTCYQCVCSDGSVPDLSQYWGTIPQMSCEMLLSNCAASPGAGDSCMKFATCGQIYLTTPIGAATSSSAAQPTTVAATTTAAAVAETTSSAITPAATSTTSTSTSVLPTTTSSSSSEYSVPESSSASTSSSTSSFTLTTIVSITTSHTNTTLPTSTSSHSSSSSPSSKASTTVSSSVFGGGAMMTAVPWNAAIGIVGLMMAGV
ncbi:hypothetical protein BP5796_12072 [Coleophoma crateriformis]|uniref:DUF7707 domain-containing protein n=1 Tax=Coleophoma crateriformis TaxID=565419 RepID=A0A3D8QC19_9HELO|nr:hypothetical protein BP5796_12072 [Coleophoma crateriformis]